MSGELDLLRRLRSALPPGPEGETWLGDDTACVAPPPGTLLLAADVLVEHTHFDLELSTAADVGWKAVAANVSDVAAMGGRPRHLLVSVVVRPGLDVVDLYEGISAAAREWECAVVGGDVSSGEQAVVNVAITGTTDGRAPVLRSGARPGDQVIVTGPLGGAAAGLRMLQSGADAGDPGDAPSLHRRPRARPCEGVAAARAGARAMIDVSDGLVTDLGHVLDESGLGVELDHVPRHPAATMEEALSGGEDYELVICADPGDTDAMVGAVAACNGRQPVIIGRCTPDPAVRTIAGEPLVAQGWEHRWE